MVKVILVRHGETEWNQLRIIQGGKSDTQLNQTGRQQAEGLASKLKGEGIQAIYSSPLQRALDTAKTIAGYHQLEVTIEPSLIELDCGELEGTPLGMGSVRRAQSSVKDGDEGEGLRMPGGESILEVQQRAWSAIQCLVADHPDSVLVVVSHFFVIFTIICSVLNMPLSPMGKFRLDNGSISIILFSDQRTHLALLNDKCHLATNPGNNK